MLYSRIYELFVEVFRPRLGSFNLALPVPLTTSPLEQFKLRPKLLGDLILNSMSLGQILLLKSYGILNT